MESDDRLRIIKYGILSSFVSTVLAAILYFLRDYAISLIGLGSLGPLVWFGDILNSVSPGLAILLVAICWLLLGIIIARVTRKRELAILMWIGCQIVGFVFLLPYLVS